MTGGATDTYGNYHDFGTDDVVIYDLVDYENRNMETSTIGYDSSGENDQTNWKFGGNSL